MKFSETFKTIGNIGLSFWVYKHLWCILASVMILEWLFKIEAYLGLEQGNLFLILVWVSVAILVLAIIFSFYVILSDKEMTTAEKWDLLNGRTTSSPKIKSDNEVYEDLFKEAEKKLKERK